MPGRRLLFLCHRIPYPPDKGERIRAWHFLDHLAGRWEVELGCLADGPADLAHLPMLSARCAAVECRVVGRGMRMLRALLGCRPGQPLTLGWFEEPALRRWTWRGLAEGRYDAVFAYSSAMAPYALGPAGHPAPRRLLDMVDVDSEKWRAYAAGAGFPRRQVWAREARTLLAFERRAAAHFDRTLFVSEEERQRFLALAPEAADRIAAVDNGVDLARFDPARAGPEPYRGDAPAIVFTGTMDYRPNVDAVCWFAREILPLLRARRAPAPGFHIVGASPSPTVLALAALPGVWVTGRVPDTRPYIAHAAVVVAPLRTARGVQNKVLEAMALARPIVASPEAFEGIRARPGRDLLLAQGTEEFARLVGEVLDSQHPRLGAAARAAVLAGYGWAASLARLDALLEGEDTPSREAA